MSVDNWLYGQSIPGLQEMLVGYEKRFSNGLLSRAEYENAVHQIKSKIQQLENGKRG